MRRLSTRSIIAFLAFIIGITVTVCLFRSSESAKNINLPPTDRNQVNTDVLSDPCSLPRIKKTLGVSEAVQLAECFILENGYTDFPFTTKAKSKLAAEAVNSSTEELVMRMRYDSLERTAYGFIKGNPDGWIIVFRGKYRPEHSRIPDYKDRLTKFGRAVSMDAYGNHIRMEHQEFSLNFKTLQKLKVE